MSKLLRKLAVAVTLAGVGLALTNINSARAASLHFSLSFFNMDNALVGEGSFSYDESTPYEASFSRGLLQPPLEIRATDNLFALTSFSATILGISWDLSQKNNSGLELLSPLLWAPLNSIETQVVYNSRWFGGLGPTIADQWNFGNPRRLPALTISGSNFSTRGDGIDPAGNRITWVQSAFGQSNGNSVNIGYAIAEQLRKPCPENSEAVPEPATIAGLTLAAAGLGCAKKKFGASKV